MRKIEKVTFYNKGFIYLEVLDIKICRADLEKNMLCILLSTESSYDPINVGMLNYFLVSHIFNFFFRPRLDDLFFSVGSLTMAQIRIPSEQPTYVRKILVFTVFFFHFSYLCDH